MTTRREGRNRARDKQRRAQLRSRRIREAELLAKLEALLGADTEAGCGVLVLRVLL